MILIVLGVARYMTVLAINSKLMTKGFNLMNHTSWKALSRAMYK